MNLKALKYLGLFLSLSLYFNYCTNLNDNPVQPVNAFQGEITLALSLADAPQNVAAVRGFLARAESDTIRFKFSLTGDSAIAKVQDIPAGDWYLQVDAFGSDSVLLYTGHTNVTVEPGRIVPIFLQLNPATGGLIIHISWGQNVSKSFLAFARAQDSVWHILLLDTDGRFKDLCEGKYPTWTDPQKRTFVYLFNNNELREYDLATGTSTYINTLDHSVNFLKYSVSLNKLLCDFHEAPNYRIWHLGFMDLDGRNFTTILADSFSEKYPVTAIHDNWIYFHSNATGIRQIYRIKSDGSNLEQVTFGNAACEFPAFSLDGLKMLYTKYIPQEYAAIVIRDLITRGEKEIDLTNKGRPIYPTFTKDSKQIIFPMITGKTIAERQIYSINIDGTNLRQITTNPNYNYYTRPMFW